MSMTQQRLTLRFITPAFLGDADQTGQWRTPPFKAQLRHWWRFLKAGQFSLDADRLRQAEGRIFGSAADASNSQQSQVRIRLNHWQQGTLQDAPQLGQTTLQGKNKTQSLSAALYAGYGPVSQSGKLANPPAIAANAEAELRLAWPAHLDADLTQTLALMHRYGTVGGRSRNGWGSYALVGDLPTPQLPLGDWRDGMKHDWPHTLGQDESGPLSWQSRPQACWEDALGLLAQMRADLNRAVTLRPALSHPVAKQSLPRWSGNDRVPSSLRFKVIARNDTFLACIFHLPCRPAEALWSKLNGQTRGQFLSSFQQAHEYLDQHPLFNRVDA